MCLPLGFLLQTLRYLTFSTIGLQFHVKQGLCHEVSARLIAAAVKANKATSESSILHRPAQADAIVNICCTFTNVSRSWVTGTET